MEASEGASKAAASVSQILPPPGRGEGPPPPLLVRKGRVKPSPAAADSPGGRAGRCKAKQLVGRAGQGNKTPLSSPPLRELAGKRQREGASTTASLTAAEERCPGRCSSGQKRLGGPTGAAGGWRAGQRRGRGGPGQAWSWSWSRPRPRCQPADRRAASHLASAEGARGSSARFLLKARGWEREGAFWPYHAAVYGICRNYFRLIINRKLFYTGKGLNYNTVPPLGTVQTAARD